MAIAENDGYAVLKHMYNNPKTIRELKSLGADVKDLEILLREEKIFDIDKTNKSPVYALTPKAKKYVETVALQQYQK